MGLIKIVVYHCLNGTLKLVFAIVFFEWSYLVDYFELIVKGLYKIYKKCTNVSHNLEEITEFL